MTPCCAVRIVGITLCISGAASMATAQDQDGHTVSRISPLQPSVPRLTVGAGFGVASEPFTAPLQIVSAQYHVGRNLIAAGDFSHWSHAYHFGPPSDEHAWSTAFELLYSTEPRRVTAFAGGGLAVTSTPSPDELLRRTYLSVHFTGGVNVHVSGPLYAFASLRLPNYEPEVQFVGGVRIAVATKSLAAPPSARRPAVTKVHAADAVGRDVRITFASGARVSERLVSLTDSAVEVDRDGIHSIFQLDDVQRIEQTSHAARNGIAIGGIAGFILGAVTCSGGDEAPCGQAFLEGVFVGGIGAGIGAAVGAIINHATASKRLVYTPGTPTITVAPTITRKGAAMAVRWAW